MQKMSMQQPSPSMLAHVHTYAQAPDPYTYWTIPQGCIWGCLTRILIGKWPRMLSDQQHAFSRALLAIIGWIENPGDDILDHTTLRYIHQLVRAIQHQRRVQFLVLGHCSTLYPRSLVRCVLGEGGAGDKVWIRYQATAHHVIWVKSKHLSYLE